MGRTRSLLLAKISLLLSLTIWLAGPKAEATIQLLAKPSPRAQVEAILKALPPAAQTAASERRRTLALYLQKMNIRPQNIFVVAESSTTPTFEIQTGRYRQLKLSPLAVNSKCMTTIVQAAYRLHTAFPNYNFVIDSHVHNCQNLNDGLRQLLAHRARVRQNLDRFNSPLHSIYLTNRTQYIAREIGRMGLYVNVNRQGEIMRRLVGLNPASLRSDRIVTRRGSRFSGL